MYEGYLIVNVYLGSVADPIANATVEILNQGITVLTDQNGKTEKISLVAPSIEYSQTPQHEVKPYNTYDIKVSKDGLVPMIIHDVEIFPTITSYQDVFMVSKDEENKDIIEEDIDDNVLWGEYAPTLIEENPIAPTVLKSIIIPEYVIVHDGNPSNTTAANYTVPFVDYVKNVTSSEIYPTWPIETIKANVAAIISFVLNRVYTEWYPSKGYNFTITSTTAYDQKYTPNKTITNTIAAVVDEFFKDYIHFPGREEPFLAQYRAQIDAPNIMSQWGSKDLGDQGYNREDILKYYYGDNLVIQSTQLVQGLPTSFPCYNLSLESCGEPVQTIQNQLNTIRGSYPAIPVIPNPDGQFDTNTQNTVTTFQRVFGVPQTGIVDYNTWYKIQYYYTAVKKLVQSITT